MKSGFIRFAALLLAVLCLASCSGNPEGLTEDTAQQGQTESVMPENAVEYKGEYYTPKETLEKVLLIGVDSTDAKMTYDSYRNSYQSDFLMLVVLDKDTNEIKGLFINRDTMMNVPVLDMSGNASTYEFEQIALSHTYGSGGNDSAENTLRAVSELLYETEIPYYVQASMDIVPTVNDYLGGITVEVLDDLSFADPELVKGETVTLHGKQALTYVRRRWGVDDSSNLHRMERQEQYMKAVLNAFKDKDSHDSGFLLQMVTDLLGKVTTNYPITRAPEMASILKNPFTVDIIRLKGETKLGEATDATPGFIEFYADEENLKETVFELFYEKLPQEQADSQ